MPGDEHVDGSGLGVAAVDSRQCHGDHRYVDGRNAEAVDVDGDEADAGEDYFHYQATTGCAGSSAAVDA